jgi:hypothetical protein
MFEKQSRSMFGLISFSVITVILLLDYACFIIIMLLYSFRLVEFFPPILFYLRAILVIVSFISIILCVYDWRRNKEPLWIRVSITLSICVIFIQPMLFYCPIFSRFIERFQDISF